MKRYIIVTTALLVALALGEGNHVWGADDVPWKQELTWGTEDTPPHVQRMQGNNLLVNGDMEEGFYWKYPNHFVANGWLRWWKGDVIPEYDDVREWRPWRYDGNHAQVYFWYWPTAYTAGIYQRVAVQPCVFYQFSMYGRNHSGNGADHHARVGIDPLGHEYDRFMSDLPSSTVWSPEKTFFYTWGLHTVTTEARSDYITAVVYVSPDHGYQPYDTFWDAGTLVQVLPPSGRLPDPPNWNPDGFITEVVSYTQPGQLVIEWQTTESASTQVRYRITPLSSPTPLTNTSTLTTIYLPLVMTSNWQMPDLFTPVDQTGGTHHQVVIQWPEDQTVWPEKGYNVNFVILARHLANDACVTSVSPFLNVVVNFSGTAALHPSSSGDEEQ